jgi:hypothetical protein
METRVILLPALATRCAAGQSPLETVSLRRNL